MSGLWHGQKHAQALAVRRYRYLFKAFHRCHTAYELVHCITGTSSYRNVSAVIKRTQPSSTETKTQILTRHATGAEILDISGVQPEGLRLIESCHDTDYTQQRLITLFFFSSFTQNLVLVWISSDSDSRWLCLQALPFHLTTECNLFVLLQPSLRKLKGRPEKAAGLQCKDKLLADFKQNHEPKKQNLKFPIWICECMYMNEEGQKNFPPQS